jgi:RNA polymerase sigma-70 factor (ECF subfamily)
MLPPDDVVARQERDARLTALLAAAAAGDAAAFEAFYEATFAYARTVARRLLRDATDIEDLLADCYFEAWRGVARFDPARGSPVTWLLTLVRSRGLDALRASASRPDRTLASARAAATLGDEGAGGVDEPAAGMPDEHGDPAEYLWQRQRGTALHAALAQLSAAERWVLGLAYLRELSHAEIAACTGMPLGTVKSHAQRAQTRLRALLAPTGTRRTQHTAS